jgi:hypothetical protein
MTPPSMAITWWIMKPFYSLTEMGIEVFLILAEMVVWSRKFRPVIRESGATAAMLQKGGLELWEEFPFHPRETWA